MNADSVLALDLGTTGLKAALVLCSGEVVSSTQRDYATIVRGNEVEQDPRDWEASAIDAIRELAGTPSAIALTGQMQDLILEGPTCSPAILYSDTRARSELAELDRVYGLGRLAGEAGNAQDATNVAAKLLWVSRHDPDRYRLATRLLLGAHDHVSYRLTGEASTDFTTASTTGLLDLAVNGWNLALLKALGLRVDLLPGLTGPAMPAGRLTAEAARATGLPVGLPVVHGAGDAASTTIGSGAGEDGSMSINLGTSGWLAMTREGAPVDPIKGVYNLRHPDGRRLIIIGAPATAAGNFDWFREAFMPGVDRGLAFDRLNEEAAVAKPGTILYLPYLSGERSPFTNPDFRAAFIGMGRDASRGDLARSVLEGVALSLRAVRDAIRSTGTTPGSSPEWAEPSGGANRTPVSGKYSITTLVGGGAKSPLWCRILAAALDCDIRVPENPGEAGVRGAAILAGRVLGWFDGYGAPEGFLPVVATYRPMKDWASAYDLVYPAFLSAGHSLGETFSVLGKNRDSKYRNS